MTKLLTNLLIPLIFTTSFSQTENQGPESIADCSGAMNIFNSGKYSIQFTGSGGYDNEISNYPTLAEVSDQNIIWITYVAETSGMLSFDASVLQDYLQMVIFEESKSNICTDLKVGTAEIIRLYKGKDNLQIGLNKSVTKNVLYPIKMTPGQKIVIAFSTIEKSKAKLALNFNFIPEDIEEALINKTKILDVRDDEFSPSLTINVRDAETDEPIIANLTIEGTKELEALYKASDIFFNIQRAAKILIKCDAEGYFFLDLEKDIFANSNQEIVIKMNRVSKGKNLQIEDIEFKPGTSEFMTGSEIKLRRLKDFMALNSEIKIEIQGHVFSKGENGFAGQKVSEARAKRVMHYLIDNGISKERMVAVGYGNTRPIYQNARLAYEEQANRRVEILVK